MSRLRRAVVAQFRRPRGWAGRLAGFVMAHRPSNLERSRRTLELLDLRPGQRVLEVGFGPGLALGWAHERAHPGTVVGVDHSELMVRLAARRHAPAIAAGTMRLVQGRVEELPELGAPFDRAFGVNVSMFWGSPADVARGLRERLRPGGVLALTYQPRHERASDADAAAGGERLAAALREGGFAEVRVEALPMAPVAAVCVLGTRPLPSRQAGDAIPDRRPGPGSPRLPH